MKKIISIPVIFAFIVLTLLMISINSCSEDNPIVPSVDSTYHYDSARYDWKIDTIKGYFSPQRLSCVDTNNIYFLDLYRALIHYDGEKLKAQTLPFSVLGLSIKAYEDKVYIGGSYLSSSKYDQPALLIKEGDNFQELQLPDSNQKYAIISIERMSNNVIWLGTWNGKLIKYESGSFQYFQFDSIFNVDVFKDNNNNVFTINRKELYDSIGTNGRKYLEINKYENGTFRRLYYKCFEQIDNYTLTTSIINGQIYARNSFNILKFNGNDFVKIIDFPPIGPSSKFSGSSESDISIEGIIRPYHGITNLFHWNGIKWSNEFGIDAISPNVISEKIKDKYVYVGTYDPNETYLIIGSPK